MKKIMALFLVIVMCLCVFAGCDDNTPDRGETSPLATLPERTEPPKTETEIALETALSGIDVEKVGYNSFAISSERGNVDVTMGTPLEDIKGVIPTDSNDESVLEFGDPKIAGVKERLSFKKVINQESYKGYYWSFVADTKESDGSIKWIEMDPLPNYDGSETMSINGINLAMCFEDVVRAWGTPDYAGVDLLNGEESIVLRWDYDLGYEGFYASAYVCFNVAEGVSIAETPIYNVYINTQFPKEG